MPHPFSGKFYDYRDPKVPVLKSASSEDIVLQLPPSLQAQDIKWISVWCRKFAVDFGHVLVPGNQLAEGELGKHYSNKRKMTCIAARQRLRVHTDTNYSYIAPSNIVKEIFFKKMSNESSANIYTTDRVVSRSKLHA